MPRFVFERVRAGLPVPGVIEVHKEDNTSICAVIDDLEVAIGAGSQATRGSANTANTSAGR
ncbi:MAG: hypothetical protein L0287_17655, partial [Anaerolineae bacterium]|nr:hypothetical protein [Anaerolineae bacterium]